MISNTIFTIVIQFCNCISVYDIKLIPVMSYSESLFAFPHPAKIIISANASIIVSLCFIICLHISNFLQLHTNISQICEQIHFLFQPVCGVILSGILPRCFPPFLAVWGGQTERETAFLNVKLHAARFRVGVGLLAVLRVAAAVCKHPFL